MEFLCFKFSHPVFFSHNTPGSMAIIVGSTRTHVFVTRIVGNDPDKGSLTFSGFPTKPNHQSPQQSKLWPRRLHECWRSLCKSAACRRTSKSATAAGSLELIDSVKSATGRWSTGGFMSAGGHSAKSATGRNFVIGMRHRPQRWIPYCRLPHFSIPHL